MPMKWDHQHLPLTNRIITTHLLDNDNTAMGSLPHTNVIITTHQGIITIHVCNGIFTKHHLDHYHTKNGIITTHQCDHYHTPSGHYHTHMQWDLYHTPIGSSSYKKWDHYHMPKGSFSHTHGIITTNLCNGIIFKQKIKSLPNTNRPHSPMGSLKENYGFLIG